MSFYSAKYTKYSIYDFVRIILTPLVIIISEEITCITGNCFRSPSFPANCAADATISPYSIDR